MPGCCCSLLIVESYHKWMTKIGKAQGKIVKIPIHKTIINAIKILVDNAIQKVIYVGYLVPMQSNKAMHGCEFLIFKGTNLTKAK